MPAELRISVTQTKVSERLNKILSSPQPHPLDQLSVDEINRARNVILKSHSAASIAFRTITLEEPPKSDLVLFLQAEHKGELTSRTKRPPRRARILFEAIAKDRSVELRESVVDVVAGEECDHKVIDKKCHAPLNAYVLHSILQGTVSI